jgi:hypothetical protein
LSNSKKPKTQSMYDVWASGKKIFD